MSEHKVKKEAIEIDGKRFIKIETTYTTLIPEDEIAKKKLEIEEKYNKEHAEIEDIENQLNELKQKK